MPKKKSRTDLEDFEQFFREKGVQYSKNKHGQYTIEEGDKRIHKQSKWQLYVSQAIFHFDTNGQYLGVMDDEMGGFHERIG